MSTKVIGRIAVALGAVLAVLSLAANPLGIGSNPLEFGWLQTLGAFLGLVAVAGGLWLSMRTDDSTPTKPSGGKTRKPKS